MSIGLASVVGFLLGGGFGFVLYCAVFIFTDAIDIASKTWDIEESYIFVCTIFICAIAGCGFAVWLAHVHQSKWKTAALLASPMPEDGSHVWPPAPKNHGTMT